MKRAAKISFRVFVAFLLAIAKDPTLLLVFAPVALLCSLPVAWYVIFDRHLESDNSQLVLQLEMLRNAITEHGATSGRLPLVRQ